VLVDHKKYRGVQKYYVVIDLLEFSIDGIDDNIKAPRSEGIWGSWTNWTKEIIARIIHTIDRYIYFPLVFFFVGHTYNRYDTC
jgi:hypothetical protein